MMLVLTCYETKHPLEEVEDHSYYVLAQGEDAVDCICAEGEDGLEDGEYRLEHRHDDAGDRAEEV